MFANIALLLLGTASFVSASPIDANLKERQNWYPQYTRCESCFLSTWTHGPECTTDGNLRSTISRIQNPPASATATFTPNQFCTGYLRPTDLSTAYTTSSGISTYTDWTISYILVTKTDLDHPTSTMFCPIPSANMECGWDTNTVAPIEQGQDWSVERFQKPEECHQICLQKNACRAYRIDGSARDGWQCEIFNVGIGVNGKNLLNPTPNGSKWWDRNCQQHLPGPCRGVRAPAPTPTPHIQPLPTAKRGLPPHVRAVPTPAVAPRANPGLSKRADPLPPHLSDLEYFWSNIYIQPACSCIISSGLPKTSKTTTSTVTKWLATVTSSATYSDIFTVTTTPRQTTIYTSIN